MATTPLSLRLNELANANSDGLLNDDEYRILRQNAFEQYGSAAAPAETPIVPLARRSRRRSKPTQRRPLTAPHQPLIDSSNLPAPPQAKQPKPSATSGMITFLRRMGQRYAKTSHEFNPARFSKPSASPLLKRVVLPRIVSRKGRDSHDSSDGSSCRRQPSSKKRTPGRPVVANQSVTPSAKSNPPPSNIKDSFGDEGVTTVKDVERAIAALESEGKRLLDAFNSLELSTLARLQPPPNIRPPLPMPLPVTLEERRNHATGLTSTALPDRRHQPMNDASSIRSTTSKGTTLSKSKSLSFLRGPLKGPMVPQISSLQRKKSVSSVSSQGTSLVSIRRLGLSRDSSFSRSMGHLPLSIPTPKEGMRLPPRAGYDVSEDGGAEIADIRRRRDEVMRRYDTRLVYLQARLKSAVLHEKLMRK